MPKKASLNPDRFNLFQRTAEAPAPADAGVGKPTRIKRTFYLTSEDIRALEEMQRDAWVPGQGRPELSQLVSQAIQLLRQQSSSDVQTSER